MDLNFIGLKMRSIAFFGCECGFLRSSLLPHFITSLTLSTAILGATVPLDDPESRSLVPLNEQISDQDARLELAKALLSVKGDDQLDFTKSLLQKLLQTRPDDPEILLYLSQIHFRQKQYSQAEQIYQHVLSMHLQDARLLLLLALGETQLGYAKTAKDLFEHLQKSIDTPEFRLDYAGCMLSWGDYYTAEKYYHDALSKSESSTLILKMKLALALSSQQRYAEAEQVYLSILEERWHPQALYEIVQLKILQKEYIAGLEACTLLRSQVPENPDYALLEAHIHYLLQHFEEVLALINSLPDDPKSSDKSHRVKAWTIAAKAHYKLSQDAQAEVLLNKALELDPENTEARYYIAGTCVTAPAFIQKIITRYTSPQILKEWGDLYASEGYADIALQLYRRSVAINDQYFPGKLSLAGMHAVLFQYEEALTLLQSLLNDFPSSYRLQLEFARILSWFKQYKSSLIAYDDLIRVNQKNPVPLLEKARVQYWAKWGHAFDKSYAKLLYPSVNELLCKQMEKESERANIPDLACYLHILNSHLYDDDIYKGYEELYRHVNDDKPIWNIDFTLNINKLLIDHYASYHIQKAASLEFDYKFDHWNKNALAALSSMHDMLSFAPGNEEARFDLAQAYCSFDLCEEAAEEYEKLLELDPLHSMARWALEREQILHRPASSLNYAYWHEIGYGVLANIRRYRMSLDYLYPLPHCFTLRAAVERWIERPYNPTKAYVANGATLGINGPINAYITCAGSFTEKIYTDRSLGTKYNGFLQTRCNCNDQGSLSLGFERQDVLENYYAIKQGIQANNFWAQWQSFFTRRWENSATYQYWRYSDHNQQNAVLLHSALQLLETPVILKLIGDVTYRNTAHTNRYIYNGPMLVDIIHPYWAPQHYWCGQATLEWYYSYTPMEFCGCEKRYFDCKLMYGNDTDQNRAFSFAAEWHHEFGDRWMFEIKGLVYRSLQWNAEGLWTTIKYMF